MSDLEIKFLAFRVYRSADKQAFSRLHELHVERIHRFVAFKVARPEEADEITSEVAEISERVSEQNSISKDDLDDITRLIRGVEIKIDQKDKDFFSILLKWMTVIGFIMLLVQEKRYLKTKDEALTKNDFEKFEKEMVQTIEEKLTKGEDIRTINRDCNLRLGPSKRTLILGAMEKSDKVIVLQTSGKWVYIQMKDDLTIHGWIYKKYIDR